MQNNPPPRYLEVMFDVRNDFAVEINKKQIAAPVVNHRPKREPIVVKPPAQAPPVTSISHLDDLPLESGFQPETDEEFPHVEGGSPRIPHIIHHIWMTGNISISSEPVVPEKFVNNVKSFLNHNPNWTYYFWTDYSARKLISDRYPSILHVYDYAPKLVVKTDIFRYVLMYEYGGLYTDLDTQNMRPLDIATTKYPCFLILVPFEQAVLWTSMPYRFCNGEIMCRAKHPFFKQCLDALPTRANYSFFPKIAGPLFIDEQYKIYNNITKDLYAVELSQDTTTPYFYKGKRRPTDDDGIYVPNTRYFLDSPSPSLVKAANKICNGTKPSNLIKRACNGLDRRGYKRQSNFTFIQHSFAASWMGNNANRLKLVPLKSVTGSFKTYENNN